MKLSFNDIKLFFRKSAGFLRTHLIASVSIGASALIVIGSLSAGLIIKNKNGKKAEPAVKKEPVKVASSEVLSSEEQIPEPEPEEINAPIVNVLKNPAFKYRPKEDPENKKRTVDEDKAPSSTLLKIIGNEIRYEEKEVEVVTVTEDKEIYSSVDLKAVSQFKAESGKTYDYISSETVEVKEDKDESDLSSEVLLTADTENGENSENSESTDSSSEDQKPEEKKELTFYRIKYDPETYENRNLGGDAFEGYVLAENDTVKKGTFKRKFPIEVQVPDGRIFKEGFNTVDGKTYFVNGGKFVTGYAEINGLRYHFDPVTGVKDCEVGIDVSSWQGDINWAKVKRAGVEFAYIRVGYRGYVYGGLSLDPKFENNLKDAQKYGIKCGVYFYSVSANEDEAVKEAEFVLDALKGRSLQLPVYCDIEHVGDRVAGMTPAQRTNTALAFVNRIRAGGFSAGIYTYFNYYNNYLEGSKISNESIWIAYYTENYERVKNIPYVAWQYTSKGSVDGISTRVDMNLRRMG